jgi:hypothetical protein
MVADDQFYYDLKDLLSSKQELVVDLRRARNLLQRT